MRASDGVDSLSMSDDPRWPRASAWLASGNPASPADFTVLGVPAHETSISATSAHLTPTAVRDALQRYSTYSWANDVDLARVTVRDAGDVADPDWPEGEIRVADRVRSLRDSTELLFALGGDNSITHSVMRGMFDDLSCAGLVTLDAHHDLRDGVSNGSPVQRLVEAGLPGASIVQIGINDFSNSPEYAARARELGITIITREELRRRSIAEVMIEAFDIASSGREGIYVDLDVDVCDRAVVPGCPAAAPGGISADELRQAAFMAGRDPRVRAIDATEVDVTMDAPDGRTIRLVALLLLEAATGLACR